MLPLATLHVPDLNPVGPPSILAAVVVLLLAGLTNGLLPLSPGVRRTWTVAAPILAFALAQSTLLLIDRFPDADDYAACILYIVAGFFFAIGNLRYSSAACRANAAVFGVVYGTAIALLATHWSLGESVLATAAATPFPFALSLLALVLLLVGSHPRQQNHADAPDQAGAGRFQFTLRGLLTGFLVVALILGLCRSMLARVRKDRLIVENARLRAEFGALDSGLAWTGLIWRRDTLPPSGDQIIECMEHAAPRCRGTVAYLQSAGLDFAEMDAFEAVVFWLTLFPLSESASLLAGASTGQRSRPDWPALLREACPYDSTCAGPNLVDRDRDGWPEYIFQGWPPEYPDKVFRLQDGKIVAWDTVPDEATGIRKGYTLDDGGKLVSFDVDERAP